MDAVLLGKLPDFPLNSPGSCSIESTLQGGACTDQTTGGPTRHALFFFFFFCLCLTLAGVSMCKNLRIPGGLL